MKYAFLIHDFIQHSHTSVDLDRGVNPVREMLTLNRRIYRATQKPITRYSARRSIASASMPGAINSPLMVYVIRPRATQNS